MQEYEQIDFEGEELLAAQEPEVAYERNRELNLAWRIVEETGANLFLTGRAGTGKTTFLRKLREHTSKRMVVLAPTGVAAINAHGSTIHSFFQFPFAPFLPGKGFLTNDRKHFNISKQKRRIISAMTLLVIDEVSMVRPDILDAMDAMLRRLRNPNLPFGGVQLLLIGDLRQLPPVLKDVEREHLAPYYPTPYFFESHALKQAGFQAVELTTVYRQTDRGFVGLLNAIRDGVADMEALRTLNTRYIPGFAPADSEGYIRLTTHNRIAADFNARKMRELPSPEMTYEATITGDFPESLYPLEKTLRLKEGAQVMFVKNDTDAERRYYNGLIGRITNLTEDSIIVEPNSGGDPIEVTPAEWENTRYVVDEDSKDITQESVGIFSQYPLKPAWAITIHKSQGLTFDRAVIDASLSFAPGQTYVALSRCRTLEGMVLGNPIPPQAIMADREVNSFIDYCEKNAPDSVTLEALRSEYLRRLVADLFDFSRLRIAFGDFNRYVGEYLVPTYPSLDAKCRDMAHRVETEIAEVGRKFISRYASRPISPEQLASNVELKEKIKRGCRYFLDLLKELGGFVNSMPRDIDNSAYAERLNNAFDALWFELRMRQLMMSLLADRDFSTAAYSNARAEALLTLEVPGAPGASKVGKTRKAALKSFGARKERKEREKKEKKPKGYSAYESLKLLREGMSVEEIARERGLTEGTIGGHLGALYAQGVMTLDEAVPAEYRPIVAEMLEMAGDKSFSSLRKWLKERNEEVPEWLLGFARK